jgi:hypothetical protein
MQAALIGRRSSRRRRLMVRRACMYIVLDNVGFSVLMRE